MIRGAHFEMKSELMMIYDSQLLNFITVLVVMFCIGFLVGLIRAKYTEKSNIDDDFFKLIILVLLVPANVTALAIYGVFSVWSFYSGPSFYWPGLTILYIFVFSYVNSLAGVWLGYVIAKRR